MPLSPLLATMAGMPEVESSPALEQIWMLAETIGDVDTMHAMAERPSPLPPGVVERLRLRKEAPVRIAYLSRPDLSDDERSSLLSEEKRSDVFAGLMLAAKQNEALATRLFEQFKARPTKVLARQFLRDGVGDSSLRFECLKVLIGDRRPPDWLSRTFKKIVEENLHDHSRTSVFAEILPVSLLIHLDMAHLEPGAQVRVLERMASFASQVGERPVWEVRSLLGYVSRFFAVASTVENLSNDTVRLLDELSSSEWLVDGDQIAGALAGRRALLDDTVDEKRLRARSASGEDLEDLVRIAVLGEGPGNEPFLQGLLENPSIWDHPRFADVLGKANPALVVKAVQATKSHEFFAGLWKMGGPRHIPDACWDLVDNGEVLRERLLRETLATSESAPRFHVESAVLELTTRGVSDDAVGTIPYDVLGTERIYRHYQPALLKVIAPQILRLQLRELGENAQHWENFNNLSHGWSGSLMELLEASKRL